MPANLNPHTQEWLDMRGAPCDCRCHTKKLRVMEGHSIPCAMAEPFPKHRTAPENIEIDPLDLLLTEVENEVQSDIISRINGRGNRNPKITHQIYLSKLNQYVAQAEEALINRLLKDGVAKITLVSSDGKGTSTTIVYATCSAITNGKIAKGEHGTLLSHPEAHMQQKEDSQS